MRAHAWPDVPFVQWQEGFIVWLRGSWAVKYITYLFGGRILSDANA